MYHRQGVGDRLQSRQSFGLLKMASKERSGLPTVMVTTLVKDEGSWGSNRTVHQYVQLLASFDYPAHLISLSILASSEKYFESLQTILPSAVQRHGFSHATLLLRDLPTNTTRSNRHNEDLQKERRRGLARLRNYLLYSSLRTEASVLWLDADVVQVPAHLLKKVASSNKPIVAVRCMQGSSGVV